ncbi:MAG: Adenylate cyclase 1 [Pseudomonadota bacterium]
MANSSVYHWLRQHGLTPAFVVFLVALIGLPVLLHSTLRQHAENEALRDARSLSGVITIMRSYYAANVAGRLLQSDGKAILSENYHRIPGAIPIPATLSIELGDAIRQRAVDGSFMFHFVSDAPFRNRVRQPLDSFQIEALRTFRLGEGQDEHWRLESEPNGNERMRLAIPVRMEKACVGCHNSHPDSAATNWKVGDVRGIQDVSVDLSLAGQAADGWALSVYLVFFAGACLVALREYQRSNSNLKRLNESVETSHLELISKGQVLQAAVDALRTKTTVLDKVPYAILMCDLAAPDMAVHYVNDAFQSQTGYLASEVLGRPLRFLHGPDTDPATVNMMLESMRRHAKFKTEILSYRRNGTAFWSDLIGFPSLDPQGALMHYVVCLTERPRP